MSGCAHRLSRDGLSRHKSSLSISTLDLDQTAVHVPGEDVIVLGAGPIEDYLMKKRTLGLEARRSGDDHIPARCSRIW